jgi:hypothetical protein
MWGKVISNRYAHARAREDSQKRERSRVIAIFCRPLPQRPFPALTRCFYGLDDSKGSRIP